jgi:hypothetical protein
MRAGFLTIAFAFLFAGNFRGVFGIRVHCSPVVLVYLNLPKLNKKYCIRLVITISGTGKNQIRFLCDMSKMKMVFPAPVLRASILAQGPVQDLYGDSVFS